MNSPISINNEGFGKNLFLQHHDYALPVKNQQISSKTCSIEVDCKSSINVKGLHVNLTSHAGICVQNVTFTDNGTDFLFLSCSDSSHNNGFIQKIIGTSLGNFIQMTYRTDKHQEKSVGQFWFGFSSKFAFLFVLISS